MADVLFAHLLPFHQWILRAALEAAPWRHTVSTLTHFPQHRHDWFSAVGESALSHSHDVIVAADGPYEPLRQMFPSAKIVSTRHSLASRNNTWHPMHGEADVVVAFSEWDYERCVRVYGCEKVINIGGPIWAVDYDESLPLSPFRFPDTPCRKKRKVVWAPSWNEGFQCREFVEPVLAELEGDGFEVVRREHYAASMGDNHEQAHPFRELLDARVLITDVSGIGLLGAMVPGLIVVAITPPKRRRMGHAQYDEDGPEWSERGCLQGLMFEVTVPERPLPAWSDPDQELRDALAGAAPHAAQDRRERAAWLFGNPRVALSNFWRMIDVVVG